MTNASKQEQTEKHNTIIDKPEKEQQDQQKHTKTERKTKQRKGGTRHQPNRKDGRRRIIILVKERRNRPKENRNK